MYEIQPNKNLCPPTLANYLTDWIPVVCGYCEEALPGPPIPHPIKRPLAGKKGKNSSIAAPFLFFVRRLHFFTTFWSDKMGRAVGFLRRGAVWSLCAPAVTEGARTAVSGSLKRFSQAEIFNLLRENKAERKRKQQTKRS